MDEIIDMLRNKTVMSRFSRGEIRGFRERLGVEGFMIAKIVVGEPEPQPVPVPEPIAPPVEPDLIGPVAPHD